MPFLRNKTNWIPLYVILTLFLFYAFPPKKAIVILLLAFSSIGVSDTVSSKIIKPMVERPRPCHEESGLSANKLLIDCGGGYSFTSSHATNHFALAFYLGLILLPFFKRALFFFMLWAGSISIAQVYVGVHYPSDIFVGGLIGGLIGYGFYHLSQLIIMTYLKEKV